MHFLSAQRSGHWNPKLLISLAWFSIFAILVAFTVVPTAMAQSQQANIAVKGNVPGGTLGNISDSEIWRQLRHGATGTVSGTNQSGAILIQAQGAGWWQTRTGTMGKYIGWSLGGIVVLLAAFFAIRGRIKISDGPAGTTIQRFALVERTGHWMLASSFIVLALTGLNFLYGRQLLIPLIGKDAFSVIASGGKFIHDYVAFAFIASLIIVAVMWVAHNIPNRQDMIWFLKGGGLLGGGHPPAYKFNAGQKILFWLIIICGASIALSGWVLLNPFTTAMFSESFSFLNNLFGTDLPAPLAAIQEQQYASLWHSIMAGIMIVIVIAHIYIGTIGMEGAFDAMSSGDVDLNWAKDHHNLWVEQVQKENPGKTD